MGAFFFFWRAIKKNHYFVDLTRDWKVYKVIQAYNISIVVDEYYILITHYFYAFFFFVLGEFIPKSSSPRRTCTSVNVCIFIRINELIESSRWTSIEYVCMEYWCEQNTCNDEMDNKWTIFLMRGLDDGKEKLKVILWSTK